MLLVLSNLLGSGRVFCKAKNLQNLTFLQVLVYFGCDELLSFYQALVDGCYHLEDEINWQSAEDERVALLESWLKQALLRLS